MKGLKHFKPKVEEREGDCSQTIKHITGTGTGTFTKVNKFWGEFF